MVSARQPIKLLAGSERTGERILVVDDDAVIVGLLSCLLTSHGYEVQLAGCASDLRSFFDAEQPDLVLLDLRLPDGDGLDLIPELRTRWPDTPIIMLTGHASYDVVVEAVKRGVFHFHTKPFQTDALLRLVREGCEERKRLCQAAPSGGCGGGLAPDLDGPVFASAVMQDLVRLVGRIAPSEASVLITGESGTGKEVIADLIHARSHRAAGPFVKVNCAALPRELIESELFGYVKGAFTGAHADREGLFRQAQGGTIFLDEISEMPLDTQGKLLRVLQHKEFRPVGSATTLQADCRIITATNRHIEEALADNLLRTDLFYRISTILLHVPPLRERRAAILPLARAFFERFAARARRPLPVLSAAAAAALQEFHWPGNIRQLENEIHRAVLVCEGGVVQKRDFSFGPGLVHALVSRSETRLADIEMNAILETLKVHAGNKTAAARQLGLTRQTLYNKLRHYGMATTGRKLQTQPSEVEQAGFAEVGAGQS